MSDAKLYGEALLEIATEENVSRIILKDMQEANELFSSYPDYVRLLNSPKITQAEKNKIIDEDLGGRFNVYLINFIKLLGEKHKLKAFGECFKEYERLYNERNKVKVVEVVTARELSSELKEKLKTRMEQKSGGSVILNCTVSEDCIGGIIIKSDDTSIDASIRSELKKLHALVAE